MASRKPSKTAPAPSVDHATGIRLLASQIEKAELILQNRPIDADAYSSWELLTRNCLEKAFGAGSANISSVTSVGKYGSFPMGPDPDWWDDHHAQSLQTQISKLRALVELLETEIEIEGPAHRVVAHEPTGHSIFVVHGHDNSVLQESARFLERLKQDVIILREQPNQRRTIIEKFEDYSNVGFAVVLLTADDRGGTTDRTFEQQRPRARQNVILELGYFLGRLGRKRVCALFHQGVEIPSDYSGVLYIELDEGGAWRLALAKELNAAGFAADMNLAL